MLGAVGYLRVSTGLLSPLFRVMFRVIINREPDTPRLSTPQTTAHGSRPYGCCASERWWMGRPFNNLTGRKYTRLTVRSFAGQNQHRNALWTCDCDCGHRVVVSGAHLQNGSAKSCGCLRQEMRAFYPLRHGHTAGSRKSAEYRAFTNAKHRCENPRCKAYPEYGGRGIEFKFKSFEEFLAHIGMKPSPELTLDRINNDGHYEIGNVRWATKSQQRCNQRRMRGVRI